MVCNSAFSELSMNTHSISPLAWERMVSAVEKVRQRMRRAVTALEQAKVPYALAGGNAIAAWVSEVDEAAVRNTQDVDILLRRSDLERARLALEGAGFLYKHSSGLDMFLDGPQAKARDAVHIVFAGEKVRPEHVQPAPQIEESNPTATCNVLSLQALVRMKLTSFRDKDRTHLRDLIEVGLLDPTWPSRLPAPLGERLQSLLDNPDG
jgi:hypothetical protein